MDACILVALKGVRIVMFHISADRAGIVVHRFVTAVSGSFQCFRFLRLSSIAVSSIIAVRLMTHRTNGFSRTGCCSSGVVCKVKKRNLIDFYIGCVEKLSAIVTFLVLVPTFYCTGRVLCRYGGLVCVSTGYRYRAGIGKVAVRSFDGDGGGAFLNTGHFTGRCVYGGNSRVVRCKRNSFVCCFCRCNGERRSLCLTDIDGQCLVNGYAGNGYRSGGDSHGCRDTSRIFGFVVLVVGYQFNQCDFVILCSCVVVNGTLEFHQCQFIGSCETLRTETVQDHIGNRCPFYRVPTKSSFDTIFKFSATCNKGQTVWNDKSAFQSVLVPRLLHVDGEIDGITGVC